MQIRTAGIHAQLNPAMDVAENFFFFCKSFQKINNELFLNANSRMPNFCSILRCLEEFFPLFYRFSAFSAFHNSEIVCHFCVHSNGDSDCRTEKQVYRLCTPLKHKATEFIYWTMRWRKSMLAMRQLRDKKSVNISVEWGVRASGMRTAQRVASGLCAFSKHVNTKDQWPHAFTKMPRLLLNE